MGLKSTNLQRSADQHGGKAAVLEENASEVTAASRARNEKKVPPQQAAGASAPMTPSEQVEMLYIEHRSLLLYVAARKFRIPESDAENLVQEVFFSFLQSVSKEAS